MKHIFIAADTVLKIYDGEVSDPKLCKNITIPRTAQASNVLVSIYGIPILFYLNVSFPIDL